MWPEAATETEWVAVDGNRLVCLWSWRQTGAAEEVTPLRGVAEFVFNDEGLIQDYEDFWDPDWLTRHGG